MSHEEPSAEGPEKASAVTFNFEKTPLQQQRFHIFKIFDKKVVVFVKIFLEQHSLFYFFH